MVFLKKDETQMASLFCTFFFCISYAPQIQNEKQGSRQRGRRLVVNKDYRGLRLRKRRSEIHPDFL